jgi:hypothetical protein
MSIIKVKRSTNAGTPDVGALKQGELAYSLLDDNPNGGNTLYVGSTDGSDSVAVPVGGKKFTDLLTATPGTPAANKAIVAGTAGALGSLVLGDGTTNSTLTSTTLVLTGTGLTFSGGNIISDGTATITGLPTPQAGADSSTVATVGYVTSVATGINVSDAESTPNTGNIAGNDVFKFAGAQGVTTLYDDSTATMTIGLQQQLDVDDDVAFGSVTVGNGNEEVLVDNNVIKQLHPSIFHEFVSSNGVVGNVFNRSTNAFDITAHGFADGQEVTYTSTQAINGFTSGTTYYVIKVDDDSFKLSTDEQAPRTAETAPDNTGGTQNDVIQSTSNPVNLFATTDAINIGSTVNSTVAIGDNLTVGGNTVIAGNLTVSGETTTVNTSVMQVDDPVLELGEGAVVDAFDRGIKFHYHDGTTANKIGFMGYDKDQGNFTLLTDASDSSQAFTGTTGTLVANLTGAVTGNASTASALATAQTFELTGDVTGTVSSDLSSGLSIATTLASDVSSSLGDYIKDLQVKGTFDTTDPDPANHAFVADGAGSSVIIASANSTSNGDIATVDIRLATAGRNTAPITDANDANYAGNWKNNLGVAEFNSDQFTVTDGWAEITTIDGGTYGTP